MESNPTLALNADGTPISILPLSTLSWQEAMRALYLDQVETLHAYDDWFINSPTQKWVVPAVVIAKKQINVRRKLLAGGGGPSAHMIYLRDDYTCQYCKTRFPVASLTKDHVIPRARGGKTTWDNVVTACEPCNSNRGMNEKIQPKTKPFRPTYGHLIKNYRHLPITIPHSTWNYYLGWPEEKIRLVERKTSMSQVNFDFSDHDETSSGIA